MKKLKNLIRNLGRALTGSAAVYAGLSLAIQPAIAGLPPTTSRTAGDSSNQTTFNFKFEDLKASRSGVTASFSPAWDKATNGGAENSTTGWTPSGTSSAAGDIVIDATNKYEGNAGFAWTPANADNYLTNSSITITSTQGLSSANCAAIVWTRTTGTSHALEAYDGTNVLATVTISASTIFQPVSLTWPCPASGTVQVRFNAGDTSVLYFDALKWGDARQVNLSSVSQAVFIGSATIAAANCTPTRTNTALGAFSTDSDCPGPTVVSNPGPGTIQTTDTDLPKFTVNNLPPGNYVVHISLTGNQSGSTDIQTYAINDGTTTSGMISTSANSTRSGVTLIGNFQYTTAGNKTFEIYGASTAGNVIIDASSTTLKVVEFSIYRFPTSTEQAYRPDQAPASWSGYHDNTCSFARTNAAYGEPAADATCAFTERTNRNFGTVAAYLSGSDDLPGFTFTPPKIGVYGVCAYPKVYHGSASQLSGIKLYDGTTTIAEGEWNNTATGTIPICGDLNVSSIASKTIRLETKVGSGAVTIGASQAGSAIEWTIWLKDSGSGAPLLTGSVTSSSTGLERVERVYVADSAACTGSPCTITSQSGGITSVTWAATGDYTVNFTAGTFSAAPTCSVESSAMGGNVPASATSTTFRFITRDDTGSAVNTSRIHVICQGAR